jgi:neudesin
MIPLRALAIATLLLCAAAAVVAASETEPLPTSVAPPLPESILRQAATQSYANEALGAYDGTDDSRPILMGVRGIVFDVSSGARFYGPDGTYHVLVGRDSTRAVARMSLTPADLNDRCDALDEKDWALLERVLRDTYIAKYPVVGHVKGGYFYPDGLCCTDAGCSGC